MNRSRLAILIFAIWLVILIILQQPHGHPRPVITHAHQLEPTVGDLPTLAPP